MNSVSATSNLQELSNCVDLHDLLTTDYRQSSSNSRLYARPSLRQVESNVFRGFSDDLFTRNEGDNGYSPEMMDVFEAAVAGLQQQNQTNDSNATETRNEPLAVHQMNNVIHVTDSLSSNDEKFVTEKHPTRCKFFEGIGPTDEDTGIPIASRTVSKTLIFITFAVDFLLTFWR